jgi:hypothetical protein
MNVSTRGQEETAVGSLIWAGEGKEFLNFFFTPEYRHDYNIEKL